MEEICICVFDSTALHTHTLYVNEPFNHCLMGGERNQKKHVASTLSLHSTLSFFLSFFHYILSFSLLSTLSFSFSPSLFSPSLLGKAGPLEEQEE